jgi:hypothetical protein
MKLDAFGAYLGSHLDQELPTTTEDTNEDSLIFHTAIYWTSFFSWSYTEYHNIKGPGSQAPTA